MRVPKNRVYERTAGIGTRVEMLHKLFLIFGLQVRAILVFELQRQGLGQMELRISFYTPDTTMASR